MDKPFPFGSWPIEPRLGTLSLAQLETVASQHNLKAPGTCQQGEEWSYVVVILAIPGNTLSTSLVPMQWVDFSRDGLTSRYRQVYN